TRHSYDASSIIFFYDIHSLLFVITLEFLRIFQVADDPLFVILQFTCNRFETYIFILINMVENDVVFSEGLRFTAGHLSNIMLFYILVQLVVGNSLFVTDMMAV